MWFDESLQGAPGKKRFIKDLHGDAIRDIGVVREAADGESLQLSIDLRLQHAQHRELHRAMKETGAAAASAVTLDARTGEILAMTNLPSFNPNKRGQLNLAAMRNRVVTDVYEPGSTVIRLSIHRRAVSKWAVKCFQILAIMALLRYLALSKNRVRWV
jgi:cell division protein FtsI (penicillin-binding protein 3)